MGDAKGLLPHRPDRAALAASDRQAEASHERAERRAEVDRAGSHTLGLQMNQDQPRFRTVWDADVPGAIPWIKHTRLYRQRKPSGLALPYRVVFGRPAVRQAGLAQAGVQKGQILAARQLECRLSGGGGT